MRTAYLGPPGSWTHQAALDLFGEASLVPLARDELFAAYVAGTVEQVCVPVITSIVGLTPYMDAVLDLPAVTVVAEYPQMLGYSLLARPGAAGGYRPSVRASGGARGNQAVARSCNAARAPH